MKSIPVYDTVEHSVGEVTKLARVLQATREFEWKMELDGGVLGFSGKTSKVEGKYKVDYEVYVSVDINEVKDD